MRVPARIRHAGPRAGWGEVVAFVGAILAVTLWLVWELPTIDSPGGRVA